MKVKISLLIVLLILLTFFAGRAVWIVEAIRTQTNIVNLMEGLNKNSNIDDVLNKFSGYVDTTSVLSHTCIFVAQCSPAEAATAKRLVIIEKGRLFQLRLLWQTSLAIVKASGTDDEVSVDKLKETYWQQRNALQDMSVALSQGTQDLQDCKDLYRIFKAIR